MNLNNRVPARRRRAGAVICVMNKLKENYNKRKLTLEKGGLYKYLFNNKGFVLVTVLIIITFLFIISYDFFYRSAIYIDYLNRFKSDNNTEYLAYSGYTLAKTILNVDRLGLSIPFMPNINKNRNIDSYKDIWAVELPEIPLDTGSVKIIIEDEQAKINISALATVFVESTPYYGILQRLFGDMGLIRDIAGNILDWVNPNPLRSPYGDYYLNLKPPYKAQNSEMGSIEELLLVKSVTPEIYYGLGAGNYGREKDLVEDNKDNIKLAKDAFNNLMEQDTDLQDIIERKIGREKDRALYNYLRVYGNPNDFINEANRININTASFRVLMALSKDMQEGVVTDIIKRRQAEPFTNINQINEFIREPDLLKNLITVRSSIFKITVIASDRSGFCRFITYYDRNRNKVLYSSIQH